MIVLYAMLVASTLAAAGRQRVNIENPSFAISYRDAAAELSHDASKPIRLQRPLVILGGFMDIGIAPAAYQTRLRSLVDGPIIVITFADCTSLEDCRVRVAERLDAELGSVARDRTAEVDVIGQSMGGLIAMYSALDDRSIHGKRLAIKRLFTVSSPLQGARLATRVPWNLFSFQRDMRPGSALGHRLATTPIAYELYSYTRLRDSTVGEQYASLPGRGVYWLDTPWAEPAHGGAFYDPRLLLDIARRLRGETPVAHDPPAPLPATD